jgi:lipopolysaccharide transport system ATP-binding protein
MPEAVIRVESLGKRYTLGQQAGGYQTLRDSLVSWAKSLVRTRAGATSESNDSTIWALRDVSFEVKRGQVLGIIGRNGAGKSTLLKLLSRVTEPTEGRALIQGRVGSLLEVGTGFHPELTGSENIFLNGAILGMRRTEIKSKFDEIVSFAEIEKFIDTPVKRYSSGMYLRLAFAVAAHLEPEILLVDEVLAVGDAEFQRKCLGKMGEVAEQGRTVLFVSHNMAAVQRLTDETILLEDGRLALRAPTSEAIDQYMTSGMSIAGQRHWDAAEFDPEMNPFRPISLRVLNEAGEVVDKLESDSRFRVEFEYELVTAITGLRVGIYLTTSRGDPIFTSFDTDASEAFEKHSSRQAARYVSRCAIPAALLNEGRFVLGVNASAFRIRSFFTEEHALTFGVEGTRAPGSHWNEARRGPLRPALEWEIAEAIR